MKIYIQIADGRRAYPVKASLKKPLTPLKTGSGLSEKFLPTITFAIEVNFDRSIFNESIKTAALFTLTNEMIQTPNPLVEIDEVE